MVTRWSGNWAHAMRPSHDQGWRCRVCDVPPVRARRRHAPTGEGLPGVLVRADKVHLGTRVTRSRRRRAPIITTLEVEADGRRPRVRVAWFQARRRTDHHHPGAWHALGCPSRRRGANRCALVARSLCHRDPVMRAKVPDPLSPLERRDTAPSTALPPLARRAPSGAAAWSWSADGKRRWGGRGQRRKRDSTRPDGEGARRLDAVSSREIPRQSRNDRGPVDPRQREATPRPSSE